MRPRRALAGSLDAPGGSVQRISVDDGVTAAPPEPTPASADRAASTDTTRSRVAASRPGEPRPEVVEDHSHRAGAVRRSRMRRPRRPSRPAASRGRSSAPSAPAREGSGSRRARRCRAASRPSSRRSPPRSIRTASPSGSPVRGKEPGRAAAWCGRRRPRDASRRHSRGTGHRRAPPRAAGAGGAATAPCGAGPARRARRASGGCPRSGRRGSRRRSRNPSISSSSCRVTYSWCPGNTTRS